MERLPARAIGRRRSSGSIWATTASLRAAFRWVLPLAAAGLLLADAALAQSVRVRIQDPLPDVLKARAAALMRDVRPGDADAALSALRILDRPVWREDGLLFLRVEADCRDGLCMTILARVTERALVPELTLEAGSGVIIPDTFGTLWGTVIHTIGLEGRAGAGIALSERNGSWVVGVCGNCFPDLGVVPRAPPEPIPLPAPRLPEPTFEAFRRVLGLPD